MTPISQHTEHKSPISPESHKNTTRILPTIKSHNNNQIFIDKVNELYPDLPNGAEKASIATCLKQLGKHYIENNLIINAIGTLKEPKPDLKICKPKPIDGYNELLQKHINRDFQNIPSRQEFLDPKNSIRIFITSKKCYANIPIALLTNARCTKIFKGLKAFPTPTQIEKDMKIIADAAAAWDEYHKSQTTNNTGISK